MFNIGDKVVCVDAKAQSTARPDKFRLPDGWPVEGRVYCVESMRDVEFTAGFFPRVFIIGLRQIATDSDESVGFQPHRFRKVSEVQAENRAKRKERATP